MKIEPLNRSSAILIVPSQVTNRDAVAIPVTNDAFCRKVMRLLVP